MSDRASAQLWCRPEDVETLRAYGFDFEYGGESEEELNRAGGAARLVNTEAILGFAAELPTDLAFVWQQEAFDQHPPYIGVCDGGGTHRERACGAEGKGLVVSFTDEGEPEADDLEEARSFHRLRLGVMAEVGMRETTVRDPTPRQQV